MNPCNVFHSCFAKHTSQFKHTPKNFQHFSAVFSLFGATWRYIHIGDYTNKEVNIAKENMNERKKRKKEEGKGEKRRRERKSQEVGVKKKQSAPNEFDTLCKDLKD